MQLQEWKFLKNKLRACLNRYKMQNSYNLIILDYMSYKKALKQRRDQIALPPLLREAALQKAKAMGITFSELVVQAIAGEIARTQYKKSLHDGAKLKKADQVKLNFIKTNLSKALSATTQDQITQYLKLAGEILIEESLSRTPQGFAQLSKAIQINNDPVITHDLIELALHTFYKTSLEGGIAKLKKLTLKNKSSVKDLIKKKKNKLSVNSP